MYVFDSFILIDKNYFNKFNNYFIKQYETRYYQNKD